MTYEVVIGLEIHVELSTKSKLFCGCSTTFGAEPNSHVCPVCLGLPGALPVLNGQAVEYAVRAGLALNCAVLDVAKFDRKNYFYPDLPKAYQVSQYDLPVCVEGYVDFEVEGQRYRTGITRVHLEEEAGKTVHSGDSIIGSQFSSIDYNRSGIPLIEVVSEPDLRSPAQARAFLEMLRLILLYTAVSDCRMEEGSLRCDANVSLRRFGDQVFGTKVEIKNMNSFRSVERALDYEVQRQTNVYRANGQVSQETRAWDEEAGVTRTMRSKEESHDYRYFADPDLLPIDLDQAWVAQLRTDSPELPLDRQDRFQKEYGLSREDASQLTADRAIADFFEQVVAENCDPRTVSNWVTGELARQLNADGVSLDESLVTPKQLASLIQLIQKGTVSRRLAKDVLAAMFASGDDPDAIVRERGWTQISDGAELAAVIDGVLAAHPGEVEAYRGGKAKLLSFFVGQVMRATKGKANPDVVNALMRERLGG